ncbi:PREDICTED: calcium-binding mitochondrial carrier protein Aralar2-like [Priapulus caudatus]|uniref:Calcium-binding mitochondrial carrier protein Aralar2-like n=1 Tax=Priapulus caudatus TaxID=37621 RepID=A0ABM1E0S8_PRICU|nr:PREDICTED: calcium-binding mitochondrial carrier protein Aralar2-like [Priapulus caudatus]
MTIMAAPSDNLRSLFNKVQKHITLLRGKVLPTALCEFAAKTERADPDALREVFLKYTSVEKNGERFMTPDDFVRGYLGLYAEENYNKETVTFLASAADYTKDGLISFDEFHSFEGILTAPDAMYLFAFQLFDTNGSGGVSYGEFQEIFSHTDLHKQIPFNFDTNFVKNHFGEEKMRSVNYYEFSQLLHVAGRVPASCSGCSPGDALKIAILFQSRTAGDPTGRLTYQDIMKIAPLVVEKMPYSLIQVQAVSDPSERSFLIQVLENAYRFTLGAIAGAMGASAVYPIDLVKTRLQNQRSAFVGEVLYKNSFDCFRKVLRHEGVLGLYRGLLPQLVGVAPEKAIKLTVNDLVRDKFRRPSGEIAPWSEIIAGGCAGGSQVMFTNPLEIVKIRLQVAGEFSSAGPRIGALSVIRDLGFLGLYKLLADATAKMLLADENGHNAPWTLFTAGFIAGMPAPSLTTPADVIKTRLQVQARAGQTVYTEYRLCFREDLWRGRRQGVWKGVRCDRSLSKM